MTVSTSKPVFVAAQNDRLVSEQGFDKFEQQFLEIARHVFVTFAVPESQNWVRAFERAEAMFPAPFGATIANAIVIAINELRLSGKSTFSFVSADCANCSRLLTQEERYFVNTFHSLRRKNMTEAHLNAMLLCEGEDPSAFLQALAKIGLITGDVDEAFLEKLS